MCVYFVLLDVCVGEMGEMCEMYEMYCGCVM